MIVDYGYPDRQQMLKKFHQRERRIVRRARVRHALKVGAALTTFGAITIAGLLHVIGYF
jgi:hypothetical protein